MPEPRSDSHQLAHAKSRQTPHGKAALNPALLAGRSALSGTVVSESSWTDVGECSHCITVRYSACLVDFNRTAGLLGATVPFPESVCKVPRGHLPPFFSVTKFTSIARLLSLLLQFKHARLFCSHGLSSFYFSFLLLKKSHAVLFSTDLEHFWHPDRVSPPSVPFQNQSGT